MKVERDEDDERPKQISLRGRFDTSHPDPSLF